MPQFPVGPEMSDTQAALLKKVDSRAEEDRLTRAAVQAAQAELFESSPTAVMMPSLQAGESGAGDTPDASASDGVGDDADGAGKEEAAAHGATTTGDAAESDKACSPEGPNVGSPGGDGGTGSAEGCASAQEKDECESTPPPSDSPPKPVMEDWMFFYQEPEAGDAGGNTRKSMAAGAMGFSCGTADADDTRLLEGGEATGKAVKNMRSSRLSLQLQEVKEVVDKAVHHVTPSVPDMTVRRCCTLTCCRTLSKSTRKSAEELFASMDNDGNGSVSRKEAKEFFKCQFGALSVDAMFNEVSSDDDVFTKQDFMLFWKQVRKAGYTNQQIMEELVLIKEGRPWVDWKDNRNVAGPEVATVIAANRSSGRASRLT